MPPSSTGGGGGPGGDGSDWVNITPAHLDQPLTLPLVGPTPVLSNLTFDNVTGEFEATALGGGGSSLNGVRELERAMIDIPTLLPDFVGDGSMAIALRFLFPTTPFPNVGSRVLPVLGAIDRNGTDNTLSQGLGAGFDDNTGGRTRVLVMGDTNIFGFTNYVGTPTSMFALWQPNGRLDNTAGGGRLGVIQVWGYDNTVPALIPQSQTINAPPPELSEPEVKLFLGFGRGSGGNLPVGTVFRFKAQARAVLVIKGYPEADS